MALVRFDDRDVTVSKGARSWATEGTIGGGGQGSVYRARELSAAEDEVTLKLIRALGDAIRPIPDDEARRTLAAALTAFGTLSRQRFALKVYGAREKGTQGQVQRRSLAEVEALKNSPHPRVVPLEDAGLLDDGRPFAVFPLYLGGTLADIRGRFTGAAIASLRGVSDILDALVHLHRANLVHRDLKPENVLVESDGRLLVADFGLVLDQERDESLTQVDETVGNRRFCPDWGQIDRAHQRDPLMDIYAVAKILWWLASGRPLLRREDYTTPQNNLVKLFASEPDMRLLHEIVGKGLASEPSAMGYRSADAMRLDVLAAIDEIETRRHPSRRTPHGCRACQTGTYRRDDPSQLNDLNHWMANVRRRGDEGTGHVVGLQMFRCDRCGHLVWYAEHSAPRPK